MRLSLRTLAAAALLTLALGPGGATAQEKPIQLSLVGPTVQIVDAGTDIKGLRLNLLYGVNPNVTGVDLGIGVNHSTGNTSGIQWAIGNWTDGDFVGWQGGLVNFVGGEMQGLQGGWGNFTGSGKGLQFGLFNQATGRMAGVQISFVNVAEDMNGLQVGLINIIKSKEKLPFFPIVNWKFD